MTTVEETIPKPELELQEVDTNSQESTGDTTKELFRREASPRYEEGPVPKSPTSPKSPKSPRSPPSSPRAKTLSKIAVKSSKKEETVKKKSSSGIPLRLKSGSNTAPSRNEKKSTYRHGPSQSNLPVINRNTLEMQFINNKKRLLQLHMELAEKQRPLLEIHKSLMRTKKQLEDMGKKVILDDIKMVTLKIDEIKPITPIVTETVSGLKVSIDSALDSCLKVSKKCMFKRDHVKILEDLSKSVTDVEVFEKELEGLKREQEELETAIDATFKENEAKIGELLINWQKSVNSKSINNELTAKVLELEATVAQQQKAVSDAEDNSTNLTRKFEEKKSVYEKTILELTEKINKLEDELKKEKRTGTENLMKTRNLRNKVTDLEARSKDAEEKHMETAKKLNQLQEQMRKKEVQWLKEKDEFKKNEELLQQKFSEKQSQLDTRLQEMERINKMTEHQQQNFYRSIETQLEMKNHELMAVEKEKQALYSKANQMEEQLEEMKKRLEQKEKEFDELSIKKNFLPAAEYKSDEGHWLEMIEYKQNINELQRNIQEQSEQIAKMQNSLKAHAQLAAGLKVEKDKAVKYSNELRRVLEEARGEIDYKNKTIYKIHEKLVLKETAYDKLKAEMRDYQMNHDLGGERRSKNNRCQICMSNIEKAMDYSDAEVMGKSIKHGPRYVSDSLIGMSVKKVDHLRARVENLKKMKLPFSLGKTHPDMMGNPFSEDSHQTGKPMNHHLRKQIELRGRLYEILQKHADQSCEDFINLLKISVSSGSRDAQELKPSNINNTNNDTAGVGCGPPKFSSNIKITESFSQYVDQNMFNRIYEKLNESFMGDGDEMHF